jgi:DNA-3-methyladenine glycosylase
MTARRQPRARRLDRAAFDQPTLRVARELLGKFLVRQRGARRSEAMIVEVEAYRGPKDAAAHTFGGRRTRRVEPLYGHGGTAYVYLVYGLHWLLNFSTAGQGRPEGVLVRGVVADLARRRVPVLGPGKVTRLLEIDGALDGVDVATSGELWVEDRGVVVPAKCVRSGPRIGVDYAGEFWAARPWRLRIDLERCPSLSPPNSASGPLAK